jgi:hypothetical protein
MSICRISEEKARALLTFTFQVVHLLLRETERQVWEAGTRIRVKVILIIEESCSNVKIQETYLMNILQLWKMCQGKMTMNQMIEQLLYFQCFNFSEQFKSLRILMLNQF